MRWPATLVFDHPTVVLTCSEPSPPAPMRWQCASPHREFQRKGIEGNRPIQPEAQMPHDQAHGILHGNTIRWNRRVVAVVPRSRWTLTQHARSRSLRRFSTRADLAEIQRIFHLGRGGSDGSVTSAFTERSWRCSIAHGRLCPCGA